MSKDTGELIINGATAAVSSRPKHVSSGPTVLSNDTIGLTLQGICIYRPVSPEVRRRISLLTSPGGARDILLRISVKKKKVKKLSMPTKTVCRVKNYSACLGRCSQNRSHICNSLELSLSMLISFLHIFHVKNDKFDYTKQHPSYPIQVPE